ncbi:MAG: hypothetical protein R3F65_21920 [bacterium]
MRTPGPIALALGLLIAATASAALPEPIDPPPELPPADLVIEQIRLVGVRVGRRTPMRDKIGIPRGARLDEQAVEDARLRLLASGLCERVDVRLDRGSARGRIRLVFTCDERVTTSLDAIHLGHARPTRFWAGAELSDLDPFGVGLGLGAGVVASEDQLAARLALTLPAPFDLDGKLRLALRYLGGEEPFVGPRGQTLAGEETGHVPVPYRRIGADATIHLDLGPFLRWSTGLSADHVSAELPAAAAQIDNDGVARAFDFDLEAPIAAALRGALVWDRRDDPAWPTRGRRASLAGNLGWYDGPWASLAGRVEQYILLPWGSVLQLDLYLGALAGGAPFFERFFIGDLHPYIPARALGLNFSRRRGPALIEAGGLDRARYEALAGRAGVEYRVPLGRGPTVEPYGVEFFVSAGLVSLATPGEPGAFDDGVPFDLAVDVGLRFETELGVMGLSIGNLFLLVEP